MIVVIPMSAEHDAFKESGYPFCKPLTEIHGKPLVEHVWNCLRSLNAERHVFVIRKDDARRFHLHHVLRLLDPNCTVIQAEGPTAGAACTALLAIEHIKPDDELIIANADQIFTKDLNNVLCDFRDRNLDAGTIVFNSIHPRWSFVRLGEDNLVIEAAEKRPISRLATAGFYYFRKGGGFVNAASDMIKKDAHTNGAFYVCPTFNEMILKQARVGVFVLQRDSYISLTTPQDLEEYEQFLKTSF